RKPSPEASYETITWDKVSDDVHALAAYFIEQGIQAGDRIGLLSENRYEWVVVDLALQLIGAVNVSIYSTLPVSQCAYILKDAGAKLFFVSTGIQLKKALQLFDECPDLNKIIAFEEPKIKHYTDPDYVYLMDYVMQQGIKVKGKHQQETETRSASVQREDIATLIYTSG